MAIIDWIKKNKLATFLIIVLLYFFLRGFSPARMGSYGGEMASLKKVGVPSLSLPVLPRSEFTPSGGKERLVVEESSMSLVTSDVRETADKIVGHAKVVGGYMVSTSLSNPQEVPFATVVVRVPAEKFRETLEFYRSLAVKVSSENILGTDVTDEYTDIEARLATLYKTKAKFEEIMAKAINVQDILQVQRELINLQDQIDALRGRQNYLEKTAELAKITVYLSNDELALPYAPTPAFRPGVIFKLAVRSFVLTLRSLAGLLIWVGVYAVVWVPVAVALFFVWRLKKKKG